MSARRSPGLLPDPLSRCTAPSPHPDARIRHPTPMHGPVTPSRCTDPPPAPLPTRLHPTRAQGVLRGFDQATNVILDESHERVYSSSAGVEQLVLGLYVVRGDNMCVRMPAGRGGATGWGPPLPPRPGWPGSEGAACGRVLPPREGSAHAGCEHRGPAMPRTLSLPCASASPHPPSLPVPSAVVGEVDEDRDAALEFESIRAEPLAPIAH